MLITLLLCLGTFQAQVSEPTRANVRVDPRIELASIVFRLAGYREYNMARVERYTDDVETRFRPFAEHAVVARAKRLRYDAGVSFDACMNLAVHLEYDADSGISYRWEERPVALDKRWPTNEVAPFVAELADFAQASGFDSFFASQSEFYDETARRLERVLESADLTWFERFFGTPAPERFMLSIGLLNGGGNYGPHVTSPDGSTAYHCVLGVWRTDAEGLPVFDASMLSTVVHEFCHSYCNVLVDEHYAALEPAFERLWPAAAEAMKKQAYGTAQTMARESLVRASVVRYMHALEGEMAAKSEAQAQHDRGFAWTADLATVLGEYEAQRETYLSLRSFFPHLIAFFDEYSKDD